MDYLDIPPTARRQLSGSQNRAVAILTDVPLSSYSERPYSPTLRSKLVKAMMEDLTSVDAEWSQTNRVAALRVVKELSRLSGSSEALADSGCVEKLVRLSRSEASRQGGALSEGCSGSSSDSASSGEALDLLLRTTCNVLLQHPQSRLDFSASASGGMQLALDLIDSSSSLDIIFLSARLVFFTTLFEAEVTKMAVEGLHLVDIFARKVDDLTTTPMAGSDVALAELHKAFFNVGLYYPRLVNQDNDDKAIVGESFHDALVPYLAPTIRMVVCHPKNSPTSLAPPITNAIAVLLNYPVAPLQSTWSATYLPRRARQKKNSNGSDDSSSSWTSTTSKAIRNATKFFSKGSSSTAASQPPSLSPYSKTDSAGSSQKSFFETLMDLIEEFLTRYFTNFDIDDGSSENKARTDGVELEDYASPALLLCRKLIAEVDELRRYAKERILPSGLRDRSVGLDTRTDFTGILVRLMSSANFPQIARASGEVLLALCGGDAARMTGEIGYGPCAGFLAQTNQLHSLPGAGVTTASGQVLDPVTGRAMPSAEEMEAEDRAEGRLMSDEEKEQEAERLFGLFDRLDRNGVIKVDNPVRKALDSGRFTEIDEEEDERERKRLEEEEREVETTVEREMKAFRLAQKRSIATSEHY